MLRPYKRILVIEIRLGFTQRRQVKTMPLESAKRTKGVEKQSLQWTWLFGSQAF